MAQVLLLTRALTPSSAVLPGLELLSHHIKVMSPEPTALITAPEVDVILIDGRTDYLPFAVCAVFWKLRAITRQ